MEGWEGKKGDGKNMMGGKVKSIHKQWKREGEKKRRGNLGKKRENSENRNKEVTALGNVRRRKR